MPVKVTSNIEPPRSNDALICALKVPAPRIISSGLLGLLRLEPPYVQSDSNLFVSIGTIDLLTFYGRTLGQLYPVVIYSAAAMWMVVLVGLGFAARSSYRWAFLAGIALYGTDMIALLVTFSMWAFAVHALLLFKWSQGLKALKDLYESPART